MLSTSPILERPATVEPTCYSRDHWSLVRCRETQLVFLANPPEYSQLASEFAWEKTSKIERQRRQRSEPLYTRLSSFAKRLKFALFPKRFKIVSLAVDTLMASPKSEPLRLVDIGCGDGKVLLKIHRELAEQGREVVPVGIEVSEQLADQLEGHIGPIGGEVVRSYAIDGADRLADNSVDAVVMHSFLEHEARPAALLKQLHSVLADDGAIVLKVPNFACWNRHIRGRRWCGFRFPDHVNYFTPATLRRLADETGYTVARQRFADRLPLSDNMYAVLKKAA